SWFGECAGEADGTMGVLSRSRLESTPKHGTNVPTEPYSVPKQAPQRIRYVRASDGVQLAWAEAGSGPVLVKASNWLTHLEDEGENPVWGHWIQFLCRHFRVVRYDERGCGMSDWEAKDLSLERRVEDLETVVAAAGLEEPFALLGISGGGAVCV